MQGVTIAALLLAPAGSADPFCDMLTRIAAAAPGNFDRLNGRGWDPAMAMLDSGVAGEQGKLHCRARRDETEAPPGAYYHCAARVPSAPDSSNLQSLAERVGRCLGVPMTEQRLAGDTHPAIGRSYRARLPGAEVVVSYDIVTTTAQSTPYPGTQSFFLAVQVSPAS